jgi:hypothetical protein
MEELIENYAFEDVFQMIKEIEDLKFAMLQMSLSLGLDPLYVDENKP